MHLNLETKYTPTQALGGVLPSLGPTGTKKNKRMGKKTFRCYLQVEPQTTFPQFRTTGSCKSRPQPGMSHKKSSTRHSIVASPAGSGPRSTVLAASSLFPSEACDNLSSTLGLHRHRCCKSLIQKSNELPSLQSDKHIIGYLHVTNTMPELSQPKLYVI
jgi:hypothetical protein